MIRPSVSRPASVAEAFSRGLANFRLWAIMSPHYLPLPQSVALPYACSWLLIAIDRGRVVSQGVVMSHCKVFACLVVGLLSVFALAPRALGQAAEGGDPRAAGAAK